METKEIKKLETGKRYHVELNENESFIILNGVVIQKQLIDELGYIQWDDEQNRYFSNDGYREIASVFGELLSYLAYACEYTKDENEVLNLSKNLYFYLRLFKNLSVPKGIELKKLL